MTRPCGFAVSASPSRFWNAVDPRLFIQLTIGLSCLLSQQFGKCRDGLFAIVEPSLRRQNRQLVVVDEFVRQLDQRELMRDRVFIEGVLHDDRDPTCVRSVHSTHSARTSGLYILAL